MNSEQFKELAWKVVMEEASPEEIAQVRQACMSASKLAAQLDEMMVEHRRFHEAFSALDTLKQTAPQTEIPAQRLSELMNQTTDSEKIYAQSRRAWWRSQAAWAGVAVAASLALVVVLNKPKIDGADPMRQMRRVESSTMGGTKKFDKETQNSWMLTPRGETCFTDPLINWHASSQEGDKLKITQAESQESVEVEDVHPPVSLAKILAAEHMAPQPGAHYQIEIFTAGAEIATWQWTFSIQQNATPFPDKLLTPELLTAARAALQKKKMHEANASSSIADDNVLQYLLRLSPEARASDSARKIEQEFISQKK